MFNADLHCHSNVSDGLLAPAEVVERAAANGVALFALTDHDDTDGLDEAARRAGELGLPFVNGVEISVTWEGTTLHIVGLRIDPAHPALASGLARIREGRVERARRMADGLARVGIEGAYEGASRHAGNARMVGRTHFARWMVEQRLASDVRTVFRHYLTRGNPGYVEHQWAALDEAVGWIRQAGGVAVLAHPGRYALDGASLRRLLREFRALGGQGIEIITGSHHPSEYGKWADIAREFGLAASRGADFHAPGEGIDIGRLPALPHFCLPVWYDWPEAAAARVH